MVDFYNSDKPYFIAEVGINHNGDLQIAKKLIDASFASNWDCVKFQKRNPDVCVPEKQKGVMRDTPWGTMTYLEYKHRVEFGKEEYDYIDKYCKEKSIDWTASVWDMDSLEFMSQYDVPFIKIPSALLTDLDLIKAVAETGKTVVLSTGMSTLEEIDKAVTLLKGGDAYWTLRDTHLHYDFMLLHCNSTYPAPENELNLRVINTLQDRYRCLVGYSGHEKYLEPPLIAITLGARVIERHITLDHDMWGTDHSSSLEVFAMDMLRKRCDKVLDMLGSVKKIVTDSEVKVREKLRPDA